MSDQARWWRPALGVGLPFLGPVPDVGPVSLQLVELKNGRHTTGTGEL